MKLRVTVLSENTGHDEFKGEHGLSLYIEFGSERILLDAGRTDLFLKNAQQLGVDLSSVDYAVLSHSHYDHADGFEHFFEINKNAKLYVRHEADEIFYSEKEGRRHYIGPKKGMLDRFRDRIVYVEEISRSLGAAGAVLLSHTTKNLQENGARTGLYKLTGEDLVPDDFSHEQTLILPTGKGLVIFNSCSHGGAATIIREVTAYDNSHPVYAYIGGFHLFESPDEDVYEFVETLRDVKVDRLITGHCTGDRGCEILKEAFGSRVETMHAGMVIDL